MSLQTTLLSITEVRNLGEYKNKKLTSDEKHKFWNLQQLELYLLYPSESQWKHHHTPITDQRIVILKAPTHFLHTSVSKRQRGL